MLIAEPIYRGEKSIMTLLFLSTIILPGPLWCSQLCYFGAVDNLFAKGKMKRRPIKNKMALKTTFLLLVIIGTIVLKLTGCSSLTATIAGASYGIIGIVVILIASNKNGKMIQLKPETFTYSLPFRYMPYFWQWEGYNLLLVNPSKFVKLAGLFNATRL